MATAPTVREALEIAEERLRAVSDSSRAEAELIVGHLLGVSRTQLYLSTCEKLSERESEELERIVDRRSSAEPLQYILGSTWFYGLEFEVGEAVLIPRPETEVLVEACLKAIEEIADELPARCGGASDIRVLDLGTGSGAIAITLSASDSRVKAMAVDLSLEALEIARRNAERHGVHQIEFVEGDLFDPLSKDVRFELIVSNPPYIARADMEKLPEEVRREPRYALDGGMDGLDFYHRIAGRAGAFLAPGGIVAVEIGEGQAGAVTALFREAGLGDIEILPDLAGIERAVIAREA